MDLEDITANYYKEVCIKLEEINQYLEKEIERIQIDITSVYPKKNENVSVAPIKPVLKHLLNCVVASESLSNFEFSQVYVQPEPVDEDDVLVISKRLYQAECITKTGFMFVLMFSHKEYTDGNEEINDIIIDPINSLHSNEMRKGISKLLKHNSLPLVLNAVHQYAVLSFQREKILKNLSKVCFTFKERRKQAGYRISACDKTGEERFICYWVIQWVPKLQNFMHIYEILDTCPRNEASEDLQDMFVQLCEIPTNVIEAENRCKVWFSLQKILLGE